MSPKQRLTLAVDDALAVMTGAEVLSLVHWHVLACGTDEDRAHELSWGERPHGSN